MMTHREHRDDNPETTDRGGARATNSGDTRYAEHDDRDTRYADRDRGYDEDRQREAYGGINWGAAFFGWLVAIGVFILLSSIVGAIATAAGASADVTQSQAQSQAGTIGVAAAIVVLVVFLIAYYAGGYVAGRMSRFDGGKQGLAVWLIGLIVTILVAVISAVFGTEYNILAQVNRPSVPLPNEQIGLGGLITLVAVILGTLLAAMFGGKVGSRYHRKVDRAAYQ
jgi:hypothetical protein